MGDLGKYVGLAFKLMAVALGLTVALLVYGCTKAFGDQKVVFVFSSDSCQPCVAMERDVKSGDSELLVLYSRGQLPTNITAIPTSYDPETGRYLVGQQSLSGLKKWLGLKQAAAQPKQTGYTPRDNGPMIYVYIRGQRYLPTVEHLSSGEHAGKFDVEWLRTLSQDDLNALHSQDHRGTVNWNYAQRGVKAAVSVKWVQQKRCLNGRCWWEWVQVYE